MSMFCFQCEQTVGGKGCTKVGVCGKKPDVSNSQDELTCALIGLAQAADGKSPGKDVADLMFKSLFATITNVNFDQERINELIAEVEKEKNALGGAENYDASKLWKGDVDIVSMRSTLLLGLRGMAAYAEHASVLGKEDIEVSNWFFKGMKALGEEHTIEQWLDLLMEFGNINLKCMALLDDANTSAYGHPVPTKVTTNVEKVLSLLYQGMTCLI